MTSRDVTPNPSDVEGVGLRSVMVCFTPICRVLVSVREGGCDGLDTVSVREGGCDGLDTVCVRVCVTLLDHI